MSGATRRRSRRVKAGATNAALFAAALLAGEDAGVARRLDEFRAAQTAAVLAKSDPRAS